ncbi:DNA cytosine methyltransferase [Paenibacillus pseudetheri]|uniref:DNA (cytosine-5-)-methyltransferase n=1 Tax=Paenibacillus pseudetheri TaxID=2897682 RepID=A0ABN8FMU0_9BACL|nr:DNA cytosine methyltransferase [Paenibacillus pseudetheri]CAH1059348.1 hypothetical protein PAECIP111894_05554 [Paenibacillus pseudetheri]
MKIEKKFILKRWNGYREINLEGLSPSINAKTTLFFSDLTDRSEGYVALSWEEVAALQSFPKDFLFEGSLKSKFKQIGNSFPPQLAFLLATELMNIIKQDEQMFSRNQKESNEIKVEKRKSLMKNTNLPIDSVKCIEKQDLRSIPNLPAVPELIEPLQNLLTESDNLLYQLKKIQAGSESSDEYHKLIFCCLNYIFSDSLKRGRTEVEINDGRKRVDIIFDNHAKSGFFYFLREIHKVFCPRIIIECKNYNSDPANPEVDQLLGRFGVNVGKFGILTFRKVESSKKLMNRCKDVLAQSGNYILFFVDDDIEELIKLKANSDEEGILEHMSLLWDRLTMNY